MSCPKPRYWPTSFRRTRTPLKRPSKRVNPKPETQNPKLETRNPKSETRNPKPETRCYNEQIVSSKELRADTYAPGQFKGDPIVEAMTNLMGFEDSTLTGQATTQTRNPKTRNAKPLDQKQNRPEKPNYLKPYTPESRRAHCSCGTWRNGQGSARTSSWFRSLSTLLP